MSSSRTRELGSKTNLRWREHVCGAAGADLTFRAAPPAHQPARAHPSARVRLTGFDGRPWTRTDLRRRVYVRARAQPELTRVVGAPTPERARAVHGARVRSARGELQIRANDVHRARP